MSSISDVALAGLLRILDNMLSSTENLGIREQFREELSRLSDQTSNQEINISELREKYFYIAQRYLSLKQPFSWNIRGYDNSENGERDINQYLELIEFSAFTGTYSLLEEYGFDCLEDFGGSFILGESYSYYYEAFHYLLQSRASYATKEYFQYIFGRFEALCN